MVPNKNMIVTESPLNLSFLLWLDCIERLDTIILEVRHLQENLIYSLGTPSLYSTLKKEETFLWGNEGFDLLSNFDIKYNIKESVRLNIALFPTLAEQESINKERWSQDQKRHYYSLNALQIIKRNIVYYKFYLNRLGLKAFRPDKSLESDEIQTYWREVIPLLYVRSAILAHTKELLSRLGDLQAQYTKSQDMGLQDHPRPLTERRREQNTYTRFLSDRCRDMLHELRAMWKQLVGADNSSNLNNAKKASTITLHRWQHKYSSVSNPVSDAVELSDNAIRLQFINTSYWMQERPDLLVTIAHEMAHAFIEEQISDINEKSLSELNGIFGDILRSIYESINQINIVDRFPVQDEFRIVKEIFADMLAATTRSCAFHYTQFLELIGVGLEKSFEIKQGTYELDIVNNLQDVVSEPGVDFRETWLRICITNEWLRAVIPTEQRICNPLVNRLLDGIKDWCDNIHEYLGSFGIIKQEAEAWDTIRKKLSDLIMYMKRQKMLDGISKWMLSHQRIEEDGPSYLQPFTNDIREFLQRGLWQYKRTLSRNFGDVGDCETNIHFEKVYNLPTKQCTTCKTNGECKRKCVNDWLFLHLYEIPWQASFLKGLDVVSSRSFIRKNIYDTGHAARELLSTMHHDSPLGRELYQVGLEFYLMNVEKHHHTLRHAAEYVQELVFPPEVVLTKLPNKEVPPILKMAISHFGCKLSIHSQELREQKQRWSLINKQLTEWVGTEDTFKHESKLIHSRLFNNYLSWASKTKSERDSIFNEIANNFCAKTLTHIHHKINHEGRLRAYVERIQTIKLLQLYGIMDRNIELSNMLKPFYDFIKTCVAGHNSFEFNKLFFDSIGYSFSPRYSHNVPCKLKFPQKLCLVGRYGFEHYDHELKYQDGDYEKPPKSINQENGHPFTRLLGRYDGFYLSEARPMKRINLLPHYIKKDKTPCFLPYFARWEMAVPMWLNREHDRTVKIDTEPILAILSVVLNRNGTRLDLVHRILNTISTVDFNKIANHGNTNLVHIEDCGHLFNKEKDLILVSDGFADLLIVFRGMDVDRINNIFQIQGCFYNDFLVDRTELMFSRECFGAALAQGFDVDIKIRVKPDRNLWPENNIFIDKVKKNLASICKKEKIDTIRFLKTPGRMDYSIHLHRNPNNDDTVNIYNEYNTGMYKELISCLLDSDGRSVVDRIQTTIEQIIYNS